MPSAAHLRSTAPAASAGAEAALPLSRPDLSDLERRYVQSVLHSPRLALGPWMERFEAQMAAQCGTSHAVAVSSGTAALHCIVRALDLPPGSEVLTTPYSFVASSNVLLYEDLVPRFVDIDPTTYNIDVAQVADAITPRTSAILAVDVFGTPADWPALTALAAEHDLALIDDACEALGASVEGRPVGQWGDAAAFGFYPNKQITTGEGGCITTDSEELAQMCRSLRNQGRAADGSMTHVRLGFNYRMSEVTAALGCAQLERLPTLLERRAAVAARYHTALAPLADDIVRPPAPPKGTRSWFVYVIRLRDHFGAGARDTLLHQLKQQGIGCAPYFPAIHMQPLYRARFDFEPGDFPVCEAVSDRTLALPFHSRLSPADVSRVAEVLHSALRTLPTSSVS